MKNLDGRILKLKCAYQTDLALSADQRQRLLDARQQVLHEIQRIVAERERLTTCLQVSPTAVPLASWNQLPLNPDCGTSA